MTAAAFKATYSDWKLIKTRSVVQIIFEVPLDQADAAYQVVGGMPDFGSERWFAIARLNPEAKEVMPDNSTFKSTPDAAPASADPPARVHKSWHEMSATQQSAIRCNEVAFQRFLEEINPGAWNLLKEGTNTEKAAVIVRWKCGVESRRDLNEYNTTALAAWKSMESHYQAWLMELA